MSEQDLQYITKAQLDAKIRMLRQEILGAGGSIDAYTKAEIDGALDVTNKVVKANILCYAYLSSAQDNLTDNTNHLVNLDAIYYDLNSDFDTTNHYFVAPVTGYYEIIAQIEYKNATQDDRYMLRLYTDYGGESETQLMDTIVQTSQSGTSWITNSTITILPLNLNDKLSLIAMTYGTDGTVDLYANKKGTFMITRLIAT